MPTEATSFGTIVDTNVLLDVFTDDPQWAEWSAGQLAAAFDRGPVVINPFIYAELAVGFARIEDLDAALPVRVEREALPWEGAFLAGRIFLEYRRRGGAKRSSLPDFYVAAHAAITDRALLTRDRPRYAEHLPALRVVTPE